jgi:hypothetical protein
MLGHSRKRDGLSPIPTVHRDGLGNAPRPPLCLGAVFEEALRLEDGLIAFFGLSDEVDPL